MIVELLSMVVALLSCVNIPPQTALDLELLFESESSIDDFVPISSFHVQWFCQWPSSLIFHSLLLYTGGLDSLAFDLEHEPPWSVLKEVGYDIPLRITLMVKDDDVREVVADINHIICNICCSLQLTNIQSLPITELCQFSLDFWRKILEHLHGLQYMKLSCGCMLDLSLLSLVAHKSNENPGGQPILDQDSILAYHMYSDSKNPFNV